MTFKIPRFRPPQITIEHVIDLEEVVAETDYEDILRQMAIFNSRDFPVVLADFIESFFAGGLDAFYEKFKHEH